MKNEEFVFFWGNESPFSNWHKIDFEVDGIHFNCSEQYMMYHKALLFDDVEIASQILQTKSQGKQKALGREVHNFDAQVWEDNCKRIVYNACRNKFLQNENILKYLLKTKGKTLVEASPVDAIWGIGLAENDPRALDRHQWRGKNWLGEVLTQLRDDLLKESIVK